MAEPEIVGETTGPGPSLWVITGCFCITVGLVMVGRFAYVKYGRRMLREAEKVPEVDFYVKDAGV